MALIAEQYRHLRDEILVQLMQQQDMLAFETFYDRYAGLVYNLLTQLLRNGNSAEDLLQETFWQVWQKAGQYEGTGPVPAWLLRIARNKALDELRRQQRTQRHTYRDGHEGLERGVAPVTAGLEQQVELGWTRQSVRYALERLPTEQRHCLELAFFEGLSHLEIAEKTNTPLGTIKTRVRSGLAKVERALRAVGYASAEGALPQVAP